MRKFKLKLISNSIGETNPIHRFETISHFCLDIFIYGSEAKKTWIFQKQMQLRSRLKLDFEMKKKKTKFLFQNPTT